MAFRDDLDAAIARADALEQRVAELEAENAQLRRGPAVSGSDAGGEGGPARLPAKIMMPLVISAFFAPFVFIVVLPSAMGIVVGLSSFGFLMGTAFMLDTLLAIARPGEFLVLSGRRHTAPDGRAIGYRVVNAGRVLRIPIVERLDRMSTKPITIEVDIANAYTARNAAVSVRLRAVVRVADSFPAMRNAIERFLGRSSDDIARVARDSLEAATRIVVSQRTVDELRQIPYKFADTVIEEAEHDMNKLGLIVDSVAVLAVDAAA